MTGHLPTVDAGAVAAGTCLGIAFGAIMLLVLRRYGWDGVPSAMWGR